VVNVYHADERVDIHFITDIIAGTPDLPELLCAVTEILE
jgi:hypothetical protein